MVVVVRDSDAKDISPKESVVNVNGSRPKRGKLAWPVQIGDLKGRSRLQAAVIVVRNLRGVRALEAKVVVVLRTLHLSKSGRLKRQARSQRRGE